MTTPTEPAEQVEHVDPAAAADLVAAGAQFVDVRTTEEFVAGHVPGARHLPLDELAARRDEIPGGRTLVMVCRSGGRSALATEALVGAGYPAVNLAGGMQAWMAEGRPCLAGDGTPGTVA